MGNRKIALRGCDPGILKGRKAPKLNVYSEKLTWIFIICVLFETNNRQTPEEFWNSDYQKPSNKLSNLWNVTFGPPCKKTQSRYHTIL